MSNRSILISGAASGIGRAIAEAFLAEGDDVHVCDSSSEAIADFLKANPGAKATQADVSDSGDVARLFADIDTLDILINNAGIAGPSAGVENVEADAWDQCIAVNLSGAFYMTHHAVPLLKQSSAASIINMSSSAGLFGTPMRSPYAASKAWVRLFGEAMRGRLARKGVGVTVICPGFVDTPMVDERTRAQFGASMMPADKAAQKIARALAKNHARLSFPSGFSLRTWWLSTLPAWWTDRKIRRAARKAARQKDL